MEGREPHGTTPIPAAKKPEQTHQDVKNFREKIKNMTESIKKPLAQGDWAAWLSRLNRHSQKDAIAVKPDG